MDIIVTGFEPFGGSEKNASWEAVRTLAGVRTIMLPVSFTMAEKAVRDMASSVPDAIICVGEAGGRSAVSIERVAVNIKDARIPDNDGIQPRDLPIRAGGPDAYFSSLPTREICEAINAAGVPAELSYTAGTYVCNLAFYALMDEIRKRGRRTTGGFIHVPASGIGPERLALALEAAISCIRQ